MGDVTMTPRDAYAAWQRGELSAEDAGEMSARWYAEFMARRAAPDQPIVGVPVEAEGDSHP